MYCVGLMKKISLRQAFISKDSELTNLAENQ